MKAIPKDISDAIDRVKSYLRIYHPDTNYDDIEISETKGYWKDKEPKIHKGHPLHNCIACSDPFTATYQFVEHGLRDKNGRFISPFRTWKILYKYYRIKKCKECGKEFESFVTADGSLCEFCDECLNFIIEESSWIDFDKRRKYATFRENG